MNKKRKPDLKNNDSDEFKSNYSPFTKGVVIVVVFLLVGTLGVSMGGQMFF